MALLLLPPPEVQFCDSDGHPFAGGTVTTYIPGTDTPKNSYADIDGTVLNTNPITLDAAGRAIIWGDGDYRLVLRDADGNLIYDQVTSAPVSDALTSDEIHDLIDAETVRAEAAEADLHTQIVAETTRAEAEENNLQTQITALSGGVKAGTGTTGSGGNGPITFSAAFPTACDAVVATCGSVAVNCTIRVTSFNASSFNVFIEDTNNTGGQSGQPFTWIAVGH